MRGRTTPGLKLKPQMLARVRIVTRPGQALVVPQEALVFETDSYFAYRAGNAERGRAAQGRDHLVERERLRPRGLGTEPRRDRGRGRTAAGRRAVARGPRSGLGAAGDPLVNAVALKGRAVIYRPGYRSAAVRHLLLLPARHRGLSRSGTADDRMLTLPTGSAPKRSRSWSRCRPSTRSARRATGGDALDFAVRPL